MSELTQEQAEQRRLQRLAGTSRDEDTLIIEMVYGTHWVQFTVTTMEWQHLSSDELWRRHFAPALQAVAMPPQVVADPQPMTELTMT